MSAGSGDVGSNSIRSFSEISSLIDEEVKLSLDLVSAARRNLGFLRLVAETDWLHQKHTILESIRRCLPFLLYTLWTLEFSWVEESEVAELFVNGFNLADMISYGCH